MLAVCQALSVIADAGLGARDTVPEGRPETEGHPYTVYWMTSELWEALQRYRGQTAAVLLEPLD